MVLKTRRPADRDVRPKKVCVCRSSMVDDLPCGGVQARPRPSPASRLSGHLSLAGGWVVGCQKDSSCPGFDRFRSSEFGNSQPYLTERVNSRGGCLSPVRDRERHGSRPRPKKTAREHDVHGLPRPDVAPAPAVLPRRRLGRKPDALGPLARDQGLPRNGPASRRGAGVPLHDQPRAQPARPDRGVCPWRRRPAPAGLTDAGRWACRATMRSISLDNFFMAYPDAMIRPIPATGSFTRCGRWASRPGRAGAPAVPRPRPPRPPGLVEPGLVPSLALREGPRAGRLPGQGALLQRGRQGLASRQTARAARPDHPVAPQAGRSRTGRADDDAVLPPDPAAAV